MPLDDLLDAGPQSDDGKTESRNANEHRADDDRTVAAEETCSADDHGGDHIELESSAQAWVAGSRSCTEYHARKRCGDAREDEGCNLRPVRPDPENRAAIGFPPVAEILRPNGIWRRR